MGNWRGFLRIVYRHECVCCLKSFLIRTLNLKHNKASLLEPIVVTIIPATVLLTSPDTLIDAGNSGSYLVSDSVRVSSKMGKVLVAMYSASTDFI